MKKLITLILLSFIISLTYSQSNEISYSLNGDDLCLKVTNLTESQNFDGANEIYAFRWFITTSEIYDQIYIEKVSYGEEGGSKRLIWRKKLDMEFFNEKGIYGEISNVGFIKWMEDESCIVSIQETKFEISNLDSDTLICKKL